MARGSLRGYIAAPRMALFGIDLALLHDRALEVWADSPTSDRELAGLAPGEGAEGLGLLTLLVEAEHRANFAIWHLEDQARRRDVADSVVADVKRSIDPWNQRRNDLMERIDDAVLAELAGADIAAAELHSETAGMMVDRLSILALKIHNMERIEASARDQALADECRLKALILREQRGDLADCLARLIDDFRGGRRFFKRYRQYKAYNDPRLNPALGSH